METKYIGLNLGKIIQHGYVVKNIEQHAEIWAERVGAGPFYISEVVIDNYRYQGIQSDCKLRIAVGYWGSIQIELIQPLNDANNLYTMALPNENGKLNHCATYVTNLDELLTNQQLKDQVLHSGEVSGNIKFVYLEKYLPGGHHLELIQFPESTIAALPLMEAAARQWDGKDPVRPASALQQDLAILAKK